MKYWKNMFIIMLVTAAISCCLLGLAIPETLLVIFAYASAGPDYAMAVMWPHQHSIIMQIYDDATRYHEKQGSYPLVYDVAGAFDLSEQEAEQVVRFWSNGDSFLIHYYGRDQEFDIDTDFLIRTLETDGDSPLLEGSYIFGVHGNDDDHRNLKSYGDMILFLTTEDGAPTSTSLMSWREKVQPLTDLPVPAP